MSAMLADERGMWKMCTAMNTASDALQTQNPRARHCIPHQNQWTCSKENAFFADVQAAGIRQGLESGCRQGCSWPALRAGMIPSTCAISVHFCRQVCD